MNTSDSIFIAGHNGLVGSSLMRALKTKGYNNILTKNKEQLDLRNQDAVNKFFSENQIDYIFLAAAKVGGILYNMTHPADFLYDNLMIACNVIQAAHNHQIKRLIYLGSSCIYPKEAPQPIKEEYLLSSELEPTNEGYALAKIAGLKLCEKFNKQYGDDFIAVMPTNLYGVGDNFDLHTSHVIPALLHKFHQAKINNCSSVSVWGSGNALREFLYVDDCAEALIQIANIDNSKNFFAEENSLINIGSGQETSIKELSLLIKELVGFEGDIVFDTSKPEGISRKLLDGSKLRRISWHPNTNLREGLQKTYSWAISNKLLNTSTPPA